ncbi:nucleotide-diphosphate-sugar epimerase [Longimycelium tulufanense]|uniref:Nucleotide-diphosphate-sugar epimerase n=1 Tax=Longimycelium tulufanense TaxID=907463 RepID=A0A8J3FYZ6_9PSEU|nr:NAD(P)H-binding protein [Longimycelium tulufanense]GGM80203.1 nucleotide-diphosphate-sugar epimerase [Longimycelium tulufanense]
MTILVTGATGTVGRVLVDQLLAAGQPVRALTRNPARAGLPERADVVTGDLTRRHTLEPVLDGVDRVYLVAVLESEQVVEHARSFLELAGKSGVKRVVFLSTDAVTERRVGSYETHHEVEQVIEESGLQWTHLRPGEFAANKLATWGPSIRAENVVRNPYPDTLGVPIHEADIAEVAVRALLEDSHAGKAYTLTGPQALSHREQAAAIGAGLGREIHYERVTYGRAREFFVEAGLPVEVADYMLGYQAEYTDAPPTVSPAFERVIGRPGRTLTEWAADHAAELG